MPMLPQDLNHLDRQTWRRIWITFAILVIALVLACAVFAPPAGAAKRPTPAPRVCVANVQAQDTGYYKAVIDGRPALVFARSARRPVLRVGCYTAGTFKKEWRVVR